MPGLLLKEHAWFVDAVRRHQSEKMDLDAVSDTENPSHGFSDNGKMFEKAERRHGITRAFFLWGKMEIVGKGW